MGAHSFGILRLSKKKNKKVTASEIKVVFSFFGIYSKVPGWILGSLGGPKSKNICVAMS